MVGTAAAVEGAVFEEDGGLGGGEGGEGEEVGSDVAKEVDEEGHFWSCWCSVGRGTVVWGKVRWVCNGIERVREGGEDPPWRPRENGGLRLLDS